MAEIVTMESLLGPNLLTKVGAPAKDTKKLMAGKDLVLLYFSASWCPPCKAFSPLLTEFYNSCAKEGKIEIVYISSDRTIPSFEEYYGKMPYLAIPSDTGSAVIKNNLSQVFKIQGIPTLVVVDAKTGEFVSGSAREEVTAVAKDKTKSLALIESWKAKERVPLSEANAGGGDESIILSIFKYFAKNPMMIFGLLYTYKWLVKKFASSPDGAATPMVGDDAGAIPDIPQEEDSEF